jgi:hypothetical protein
MRRPSRQVEILKIKTGVSRFKGAAPTTVPRNALDRSIQRLVSLMDIDRHQGALKNDPLLNIADGVESDRAMERPCRTRSGKPTP